MKRARNWQCGQSGLIFAALLPAVLALLGLLVDGGAVLLARRQAQVAADSASLSAAQSIDWTVFEGTNHVLLNKAAAESTGTNYGQANFPGASTSCVAGALRVTCTTRRTVSFVFMPIFGLNSTLVTATSTADLLYGIESEGQ